MCAIVQSLLLVVLIDFPTRLGYQPSAQVDRDPPGPPKTRGSLNVVDLLNANLLRNLH